MLLTTLEYLLETGLIFDGAEEPRQTRRDTEIPYECLFPLLALYHLCLH